MAAFFWPRGTSSLVVYCMWGELSCVCCRWTEPHSKRIKVKLTVQAEVYAGTVLEQQALVEFVVTNKQCRTCAREESALGQWVAVVQLRQRGVTHRRTFLLLEQLIIRHHAQRDCVSLKSAPQGIDFFFTERGAAAKFVSFVQGAVPCAAVKESSRVVVRAFLLRLCLCLFLLSPRPLVRGQLIVGELRCVCLIDYDALMRRRARNLLATAPQ
eukprot:COSAG01_NODE_1192_length_11309_cov_8.575609_3_plen_213_part_00